MSFEREQNRADAAEAAIERLLATPAATTPGGGCLDAETASAWAERRLLPNELTAVEAHVADCPRCQELIAVIVQTTPVREAADTAPLVTRWRFGWLVPVGAAAALVVWVAVGRDTPILQEQTAQQYDAVPLPAAEPPPSADNNRALADKADTGIPDRSARDELTARSALEKSTQTETRQESAADSTASRAKAAADVAAAVPTPPAIAPAVPAAPTAPAAPPRAAPSRADTLMRAASVPLEIVSSDGAVRWRVVPAAIQRSLDGGRTWTPVAVDPSVTFTAGASPAPSVCWLVGRAGVVMLTVDGVTFRRLTFPATTDLIAVRATSAQAATVTAADGRQFETTDAGNSWR